MGSSGNSYILSCTSATNDYSGDFVFESAHVSWGDGDDSPKAVVVPLVQDNIYEFPDERIVLCLTVVDPDLESAKSEHGQEITITILDDNDAGFLSFNTSAQVVNEEYGELGIPINRRGGSSANISVKFFVELDDTLLPKNAVRARDGKDFELLPRNRMLHWKDGDAG